MGTKSVNVDVDVDVDLNDFEIDDVVDHVIENIENLSSNKMLELQEAVVNPAVELNTSDGFDIDSINDLMKLEHLKKIFSNYTLEQLEKLLPE